MFHRRPQALTQLSSNTSESLARLARFTRYLRFARQNSLRIAYGIALSRSCYWVALFVYGPIYVIESGLPTYDVILTWREESELLSVIVTLVLLWLNFHFFFFVLASCIYCPLVLRRSCRAGCN